MGREAEIALLRDLLGESSARRPAAVAVEGAPGLGKTRLLRDCLSSPGAPPAIVLTCRHLQQPVPFWPLIAAWRQAGLTLPDAAIKRPPALGVPVWARLLAEQRVPSGAVVVLVAAQWSDPWTLRVLDAALSGALATPPLLVVAYRPHEASAELATLLEQAERAGGVERVRLAPLPAEAVEAAIAERVAAWGSPPESAADALAAWLIATAGGLPDLLEAAAAGLCWGEILEITPQGWRVDAQRLGDEYPPGVVPRSLENLIRRRLAELDDGDRGTRLRVALQICAAAGGTVALSSLEAAMGHWAATALDGLVARHLIVYESDEWGTRYRLAVPALGRVALAEMGHAQRERLQARAETQ
jgi:hypothetical protein